MLNYNRDEFNLKKKLFGSFIKYKVYKQPYLKNIFVNMGVRGV